MYPIGKSVIFLSQAQTRLTDLNKRIDYVWCVLVASVPIFFSLLFGIASTQQLSYPAKAGLKTAVCIGYLRSPNWYTLTVSLPLALWLFRVTAHRLFDLDRNPTGPLTIPKLLQSATAAEQFRTRAWDGLNLAFALLITFIVHCFDMKEQIGYVWLVLRQHPKTVEIPSHWDWTGFFLTDPENRLLLGKQIVMLTAAYLTQFLLVLLVMNALILLARHNFGYLHLIYRRSRDTTHVDGRIVLDLRDPKHRLGLHELQNQFNFQIRLLSIAALFTILSRVHFANIEPIRTFISGLTEAKKWAPNEFIASLLSAWGPLFPTIGQGFFVLFWVIMFAIVFSPALAKLVPLRSFHDRNPSTQEFLLELIPPGSPLDMETGGLTKEGSVESTSKLFAASAFWPSGNGHAEYLCLIAFFVFFFMLTPVFPQEPFLLYGAYYILLGAAAFAGSKMLFAVFRYRLQVIGKDLDL